MSKTKGNSIQEHRRFVLYHPLCVSRETCVHMTMSFLSSIEIILSHKHKKLRSDWQESLFSRNEIYQQRFFYTFACRHSNRLSSGQEQWELHSLRSAMCVTRSVRDDDHMVFCSSVETVWSHNNNTFRTDDKRFQPAWWHVFPQPLYKLQQYYHLDANIVYVFPAKIRLTRRTGISYQQYTALEAGTHEHQRPRDFWDA